MAVSFGFLKFCFKLLDLSANLTVGSCWLFFFLSQLREWYTPGCVLVDHLLSQKLVLTFLKLTVFLESVWALLSENTSYFVGWVNMGHILAYLCVGGLGWWEGDFLCECMAHFEMANLKSQKKRTFQVCW